MNYYLRDKLKNDDIPSHRIYLHYSDVEHTYAEHICCLRDDLMKFGYSIKEQKMHYANHWDVGKYYPAFLCDALRRKIANSMKRNNSKKIGLCIVFKNYNYGSILQSYATLLKLQSLGYEYEIINYSPKKNALFYLKSVPRLLNRDMLYGKIRSAKSFAKEFSTIRFVLGERRLNSSVKESC